MKDVIHEGRRETNAIHTTLPLFVSVRHNPLTPLKSAVCAALTMLDRTVGFYGFLEEGSQCKNGESRPVRGLVMEEPRTQRFSAE